MGYNVSVDNDKCVGCGECVDVCPVEVYEIKDGNHCRRSLADSVMPARHSAADPFRELVFFPQCRRACARLAALL